MEERWRGMEKQTFKNNIEKYCNVKYGKKLKDAENYEVFNAVSLALLEEIVEDWNNTTELYKQGKRAFYISAEYLMGRALGNNVICMNKYEEVKEVLDELHIDMNVIEEIEEDAGLGNGGLGRLAACFMESAAAMHLPLVGYGLRYQNGLFNQKIVDGCQVEEVDTWLKYGDPWSIRKDSEAITVNFEDFSVKAVPYDVPIIGYNSKNINTLRLWQSEAFVPFDFTLFCEQEYSEALQMKNEAENITRVLYPADSKEAGKILRLRQQYFMVSASLQDMVRNYKKTHSDMSEFAKLHAVQLNDTHPTLAIPELIRILVDEEDVPFNEAMKIAEATFAYTNHTILAEALEKWDIRLIKKISPRIFSIVEILDARFVKELQAKGYDEKAIKEFSIIGNGQVRMANLAIYMGHAVNGVAQLHTDILMNTELHNWYELYPEKFQNKTNGITPRRWLKLCNKELSALITELLGNEEWVTRLSDLEKLEAYVNDDTVLERLIQIKHTKKEQLAAYIKETEGVTLDPDSLFDIQIKRLHEYKRQLLNAFYILDLYYRIKENPDMDMPKTTFIFGAKAFPSYRRAKSIVRFIGEIAKMIDEDPVVSQKIKVHFVQNYRVSYGEKLFPAADISKQISTAGKEASGTGNMKFMLNGALTFGTYDGANVEIVAEAGEENNFIFGLRVEDIEKIQRNYKGSETAAANESLNRVVNTLIDGTFDDKGTGDFRDLYNSLMVERDTYFVLEDFAAFREAEDRVFAAYKDQKAWAKMCLMNIAHSGIFSSDRTIMQYANDIWDIKVTTNK